MDIKRIWQELLEKSDRTSPAEYPDMALITFDEFASYAGQSGEPIAYLRDVGSAEDPCYVPCAAGDPGGFPVYGEPS